MIIKHLSERRINLWFAGSSRAASSNNLSAAIILDFPQATYNITHFNALNFQNSKLGKTFRNVKGRKKTEHQCSELNLNKGKDHMPQRDFLLLLKNRK